MLGCEIHCCRVNLRINYFESERVQRSKFGSENLRNCFNGTKLLVCYVGIPVHAVHQKQ